jgi:hypothetical protein
LIAVWVWIGIIDELEELDELAAAVAISLNFAGQQVDTGEQGDRAVALVFRVAREVA